MHTLDSFQGGCHTSVVLLATLGSGVAASTTLSIATTQAMFFTQHGHLRLPLARVAREGVASACCGVGSSRRESRRSRGGGRKSGGGDW